MGDERPRASTTEALRQIGHFWRMLLEQVGARRLVVASALVLLASLSEAFALFLLIPLVQTLEPSAGAGHGATAWLSRFFQSFGLHPNLPAVLAIFVSLMIARSFINLQASIHLQALRLNLIRDVRVNLYSAIAHANWSFLRHRRRSEFFSALTAETDRLNSAVQFALEIPARAVMISAYIFTACLIAPALTLGALATGCLLAWLVRGRLTESLQLGEMLSTAYEELYHRISEFLAGLKITKSCVSEDLHVKAFAGAIDEVKGSLFSYVGSRPMLELFRRSRGSLQSRFFFGLAPICFTCPSQKS